MGRVSSVDKTTLVSYDKTTNISTCLVCNKSLSGCLLGNIKRHYETVHKHMFGEAASLSLKERKLMTQAKLNQGGAAVKLENLIKYEFLDEGASCSNEQSENATPLAVTLAEESFLKSCVGLVTMQNVPLSLFNDEVYFKKLMEPYENRFGCQLNSNFIMDNVRYCASKVRDHLRQIFWNKVLSLKIDIVKTAPHSILGINVQYIENFNIVTNTIDMTPLKDEHTGIVLTDMILQCLGEFNIQLNRIYAIATDNGANVLKAAKMLQQVEDSGLDPVVVRCSANCIHLAAHDCIKELQPQLDACRNVVQALRNRSTLEMADACKPTLDSLTRWNTTLEMMQRLAGFQNFIAANSLEFSKFGIDWSFVANFTASFAPLEECYNELRAEQYVVGDFYRDWLVCEAKLKKMKQNPCAAKLLTSMQSTKEKLLTNAPFLAAIYFDPRFNFSESPFLNNEQRKVAMTHIMRTHADLNKLADERMLCDDNSTNALQITHATSFISPNDPYQLLEEELTTMSSCTAPATQDTVNIRHKLDNLSYGQRMPFGTNVLKYWRELPGLEQDISKLVEIVLALPSSQASIDCAFNAITTIKRKQRLSFDAVSDMLVVQLNRQIFEDLVF